MLKKFNPLFVDWMKADLNESSEVKCKKGAGCVREKSVSPEVVIISFKIMLSFFLIKCMHG